MPGLRWAGSVWAHHLLPRSLAWVLRTTFNISELQCDLGKCWLGPSAGLGNVEADVEIVQ